MDGLTFNQERHEYRLGGRVLPSVTQVIRAVIPGWNASAWHMARGSATHHGCRLLDEGRLDWSSVSPEIEGRIRAWQAFRDDCGPHETVACETPMASDVFRFAGTCDRIFEDKSGLTIIDIKSTIEPQVILQLGAYSILFASARKLRSAGAVQLCDDGSYKTLWLNAAELKRAEQQFLATLSVYNFMSEHNLLPKGNA